MRLPNRKEELAHIESTLIAARSSIKTPKKAKTGGVGKILVRLSLCLGSFERDVTMRQKITFWARKPCSNLRNSENHEMNWAAINFCATRTDFFVIAFYKNVAFNAFDFSIEYELALSLLELFGEVVVFQLKRPYLVDVVAKLAIDVGVPRLIYQPQNFHSFADDAHPSLRLMESF
jgi:hypothetical protein